MLKLMKFPIMFLAFAALTFVSCDSEIMEPETDNYTLDQQDREMMGRGKPDCFKLIFPITLELKNGRTKEIADKESMKRFLKLLKKGKGHGKARRPKIQFPYQVELKNGNTVTVENEADQKELRRACHISKARKCFKPVLPVTMVFADGTTQEVTSKEEMKQLYRTWFENHEDGEARPTIQYPYDVKLKDGTVVTVESRADLKRVIEGCKPNMVDHERCFRFNFPVTVIFPNESEVTLENPKALHTALKVWKRHNPNADTKPEFEFPLDVTMKDGTINTVNTKEELHTLKDSCE